MRFKMRHLILWTGMAFTTVGCASGCQQQSTQDKVNACMNDVSCRSQVAYAMGTPILTPLPSSTLPANYGAPGMVGQVGAPIGGYPAPAVPALGIASVSNEALRARNAMVKQALKDMSINTGELGDEIVAPVANNATRNISSQSAPVPATNDLGGGSAAEATPGAATR